MSKENPKFLICDDSILARKKIADTLASLGYTNLISVSNVQEAVNIYKLEKPDVVILDIVMPVKDGIEAVKGIMEINDQAQIIIVSSVGTQTQLKAALEAGAKDFIQKPIETSHVETLLQTHLG